MHTRFLTVLATILPALALAQTPDVPTKIGYQGRLLKADGTPESGVVRLSFAVYAAEAGGTSLWSEDQDVGLSDGFYAVFLGSASAFPADLFDGSDRWLELSMGGRVFTPRQRVASLPYALRATTAKNLIGGTVEATSVSINGTPLLNAGGKIDLAQVSGCSAPDQVLSWNGAAWTCTNSSALEVDFARMTGCQSQDQVLAWTGTAWSCTSTSQFQIGHSQLSGCPVQNQLLHWDGSAWTCTNTPGGGLTSVATSDPMSGAGTSASPLTMARASATADGYLGQADFNAFAGKVGGVTATANRGIEVNGTAVAPTVGLATCPNGQILKSGGTTWACAADNAGVTQVVAGQGLTGGTITSSGTLAVDPAYAVTVATPQSISGTKTFTGPVTFKARLQVNDDPETTYDITPRRYVVQVRYGDKAGTTRVIPADVITDYCADADGCYFTVRLRDWSGAPGEIASDGPHHFNYSLTNGYWRTTDPSPRFARDRNGTNDLIFKVWNCVWEDGQRTAFGAATDATGGSTPSLGFYISNEFPSYANIDAKCELILED